MERMGWATGPLAAKAQVLEATLVQRLSQGLLGIACSGGLDSRLLAYLASRTALAHIPNQLLLVHIAGPHVPAAETSEARNWAERLSLDMQIVTINPLELPEVARNGQDRCYHCKKALFSRVVEIVAKASGGRGFCVCDGSNASDHRGFRPGLRALKELGIRSPLDEAGLTKEEIRQLARESGLDRPEQTARPCLLTRFPYGMTPSIEALRMLETMEARIDATLRTHLEQTPDFRIRATAEGSWILQMGDCPEPVAEQALHAAGLTAEQWVRMEHPSGYFDRESSSGRKSQAE